MNARSVTGAGFTIVETMIFLAISGLMFVLAISAMSGKTQQTEFQTSVDTLKSQLNQQLSNVASGNYAAVQNNNCTAGSTGAPQYSFTTSPQTPNGSCDIIGEIISFNPSSYYVIPVIGRNYVAGDGQNAPVTDLTEAVPQVSNRANQTITTVAMPFGLQIVQSTSSDIGPGGRAAIGLFSFTSFEGSYTGSGLNSGSEHVEVAQIPGITFNSSGLDIGAVTADINSDPLINCGTNNGYIGLKNNGCNSETEQIDPASGITFCVESGTTNNQWALFTIGGADSPDTATYQIYGTSGC